MTSLVISAPGAVARSTRLRHFLMCPPTHFAVAYSINPWMDPTQPADRTRALQQWQSLVEAYRSTGHRVDELAPVEGLPDMVFAANGATVIDGQVLQAKFAHSQRAAEAGQHGAWHAANGILYGGGDVTLPGATNEAEGDFAVLADRVLAGYGFRTSLQAHHELAALTGREVISVELVDPRFYHLDVALTVLDDVADHIAYYPPAFSLASQQLLAGLFPEAIIATDTDAYALGLNCVSDGLHVFIPAGVDALRQAVTAAGYRPVAIDLSELSKGGGSVKCCTQEIRGRGTSTFPEQVSRGSWTLPEQVSRGSWTLPEQVSRGSWTLPDQASPATTTLGEQCQTADLLRGNPGTHRASLPSSHIEPRYLTPPTPSPARTWAPARYGHRLTPPS